MGIQCFFTRHTDLIVQIIGSLPSRVMFSSVVSVQNIRYPREYTANIYVKIAGLKDLHYWARLEKLSLLSLQRRRERYIAIHMWKIRHGLTSNDIQITFVDNNRHGTIAKVPPMIQKGCKLRHISLLENSFAIMGLIGYGIVFQDTSENGTLWVYSKGTLLRARSNRRAAKS